MRPYSEWKPYPPIMEETGHYISNLGSPSSASSVTGADAFSKINTLNNDIDSYRGIYSDTPTLATGWTASDIAFRRIDRICIVYTRGLKCNTSDSGWVDVCDVPNGYKNYTISNGVLSAETSDYYTVAEVRVNNGKFQLYSPVANLSYFGTLWYFRTSTGT